MTIYLKNNYGNILRIHKEAYLEIWTLIKSNIKMYNKDKRQN